MELHMGEEESKTKSNPKSDDKAGSGEGEEEDDTSIGRAIACIKKDLFKVDGTSGNYIQGEASKLRRWKLIPKVATASTPHEDGQPSVMKGAKFAEGTQFVEKVSAAKKTPGKDAKTNDCIVKIKIKLTGGHKDIPESIMGMINTTPSPFYTNGTRRLAISTGRSLWRQAKPPAFLRTSPTSTRIGEYGMNKLKLLQTANNIPANKSRSFSVLFNFRSEYDPAVLLEKTSLKMATQMKIKGTMMVEIKPCQCLDTARDIIFFNLPFCNAIGLQDFICRVLTKQKSALIHRHPLKYPQMEWGQHLPEFEMVRDFVKNTPWRSWEEKTPIQAFHKIAWHLECPQEAADRFYTLIKVMKKNKTLYCILGYSVTVTKNPGPNALPGMRTKLAQAVHWHTSFQMLINHVPLQGLVNPDKVMELHRVENKEGDPQESVFTSVREVMSKHKINHLPFWQGILPNDDGSWKGFHLNGQGCKAHKGVASRWSGCVFAHFCFHLMKRGVTDEIALALI